MPVSGGTQFASIAAGATTCAIATSGLAWCWGDDREKQLGVQAPLNQPLDCGGFCSFRPRTVASMFGARTFLEVDVGIHHTCGASETQTFCWGSGVVVPVTLQNVYLLGNSTIFSSDTAVVLSSGALRLISVGGEHACGLVLGVSAKCWGRNDRGQLGIGSTGAQAIPATVAGPIVFAAITAGGEHTCGLDGTGTPYCWGDNSSGQLGATTTGTCTTVNQSGIPITVPCSTVPVRAVGSLRFALLSAGLSHTCGVAVDGAAYCWGEGIGGKLGNNAVASSPTAVRVTEPR